MRYSQKFVIALAVVVLIFVSFTVASADVYSGRAAAVEIMSVPQAPRFTYVDTGELPAEGGELAVAADRITVGLDVLRAEGVRSAVDGAESSGEAISVLEHVMALEGESAELSAASILVRANATCDETRGSTEIAGLRFAGRPIIVSGEPNQRVVVDGVGTLIINEHITVARSREITVRALRLVQTDGRQLVIGTVRAGLGCIVAVEPRTWQSVKSFYRD